MLVITVTVLRNDGRSAGSRSEGKRTRTQTQHNATLTNSNDREARIAHIDTQHILVLKHPGRAADQLQWCVAQRVPTVHVHAYAVATHMQY